jgi:hypothetical protein
LRGRGSSLLEMRMRNYEQGKDRWKMQGQYTPYHIAFAQDTKLLTILKIYTRTIDYNWKVIYWNILLTLIPRHCPKSDGNSTPNSESKHIHCCLWIKTFLFRSYTYSLTGWCFYDSPLLYFFPFQSLESG